MNLSPPEKVWKLQTTLHAKAKGSPDYRFYLLYDKVHRKDVLAEAWRQCRVNDGAPGVDGQTFTTSKRTASSGGWTNWRKSCGRRSIVRKPCGGCTFPSRTASSDR